LFLSHPLGCQGIAFSSGFLSNFGKLRRQTCLVAPRIANEVTPEVKPDLPGSADQLLEQPIRNPELRSLEKIS
jgi:hypothetical protein